MLYVTIKLYPKGLAFYPLPWTDNPYNGSLRELAAFKMHSNHVTMTLVGSYPTFSPLPQHKSDGSYFLLHYFALTNNLYFSK